MNPFVTLHSKPYLTILTAAAVFIWLSIIYILNQGVNVYLGIALALTVSRSPSRMYYHSRILFERSFLGCQQHSTPVSLITQKHIHWDRRRGLVIWCCHFLFTLCLCGCVHVRQDSGFRHHYAFQPCSSPIPSIALKRESTSRLQARWSYWLTYTARLK